MVQQLSEHISTVHTQLAEVLTKIVKDKHDWVAERKRAQPLESFRDQLVPSDRGFYTALKGDHTAFILECKKASPSKGLIREHFDLDSIAQAYAGYANAISVLTDEKYFQGRFEFLPQVRQQVTQPILCKDFMIDTYQVYLARHYHADAILLMLSVLDDETYQSLASVAHELNMGILTEVSHEAELERALRLKAQVIGINNRNLRDLTTDLNRTKALAPKIPDGTVIISESGIYTHQQVRELARDAHGFLIGSSLMAEDNLPLAVRRIVLGDNKVCGLTSATDAKAAYDAGAVYGGVIFVEKSPRHVSIQQAQEIMAGAPLHYVGVFQNHPMQSICDYARKLGLYAVQLHGDETQDDVDALRTQLPEHVQIWKAYGVMKDQIPQPLTTHVDRHVFDTKVGTQAGGTGQTFDWQQLTHSDHAIPLEQVMLAGGITPDNAREAAAMGCLGLDLNSGVESAPGHKDPLKLQLAFTQIRHY